MDTEICKFGLSNRNKIYLNNQFDLGDIATFIVSISCVAHG